MVLVRTLLTPEGDEVIRFDRLRQVVPAHGSRILGRDGGGSTALALIGLAAIGGVVVGIFWAMATLSYDVWTGILTGVVLVAISTPLLLWAASKEDDPRIAVLIPVALVAKLAAAGVRYFVAFDVYGGTADASMYISWGNDLAELFRAGIFDVDVGRERFIGTGFMRYLVGVIFAVTGVTGFGGFVVFSWLGFWGLYGFHRAFKLAVPDGNHFRYALLVFLLPSVLYWPSSVGKEAWMLTMLGLTAYGAARLLTRGHGGYLATGLGLLGMVMLRPHIAAVAAMAITAGYLWRTRKPGQVALFGPLPQVIGILTLVGVLVIVLQLAGEYFDLEEGTGITEGTEEVLDRTESQTSRGSSTFDSERAITLVQLPQAVATVLFRPFPWEADNAQMLLTSMEGVFLLALFMVSWRRVWAGVKQSLRNPYLRFAILYAVMFMIAYTAVANFGILARQRVQVFPFALMFLATAPHVRRTVNDVSSRFIAPRSEAPHRPASPTD